MIPRDTDSRKIYTRGETTMCTPSGRLKFLGRVKKLVNGRSSRDLLIHGQLFESVTTLVSR